MTAQMNDLMDYDGRQYSISAIKSKNALFNVEKLGLHPIAASSACWRGYIAKFGLDGDSRLLLTDLFVNIEDEKAPAINGMLPNRVKIDHNRLNEYDFNMIAGGNTVYRGVDLPLPFTGSMIICDGFIQELYVHMGFHDPYKYEKVIELCFHCPDGHALMDGGNLVDALSLIAAVVNPAVQFLFCKLLITQISPCLTPML